MGGIEGVEPEATRSRRKRRASWAWKYMPPIPELRRQRHEDQEVKGVLSDRVSLIQSGQYPVPPRRKKKNPQVSVSMLVSNPHVPEY